jgi:hypothetical protein
MAQRRIEQAAAATMQVTDQHDESPDEIEDVERLVDMDDDDEEEDDDEDDEDDDEDDEAIVRGLEVDDAEELFGSDDSVEGEDVGIVMKKHEKGSVGHEQAQVGNGSKVKGSPGAQERDGEARVD